MGGSTAFQLKRVSCNMRLRRIRTVPLSIKFGPTKGIFNQRCEMLLFSSSVMDNWTRSRQYFRIFMVVNRDIRESAGDSEKS
jgi:hypothetical protein